MIVHRHWQRTSTQGIADQHIAIVGYSQYNNPNEDSPGFTNWVLDKYISGDSVGGRFFPPIQRYFGYSDRAEFWNRVHFFNYIPQRFSKENKFATGGSEYVKQAKERFLRILAEERPDKVFVFSRKGWNQCPPTVEENSGARCKPLKSNPKDTWGTYNFGGHKIRVCGFRHPLYARHDEVTQSVHEFLRMT